MIAKNIVLFGKHPAWSDHMFVSDGTATSNYLKRVFYDHSVIPALQGGEGDERISENWSFLVIIEEQPFFIVNAISRDSVGRRRFPLIAAYPLPHEIKLEAALDGLRELKQELLCLLNKMLESESEDLNQWQEMVTQEAKSFKSKVNWSSIDSKDVCCQLKHEEVVGLLSRLADDYDSLDLKSCSFLDACSFLKLGLKQFKHTPPAMLILDQEEQGAGLFFAMEDGTSFHLKHKLYNKLASLSVSASNVPQKVSRLLKSKEDNEKGVLKVDEVPSLKLHVHHSAASKFTILAIAAALLVLVVFGLLYGCGSQETGSSNPYEENSKQISVVEKWTLNASAYVEWIQPLQNFVAKQSEPIDGFEAVAVALKSDLNPFAVVEAEKASIKLAKNPPEGFFDPENNAKLSAIYDNIEQLQIALKAYFEEQFSDKLLKELKRQNYPQPTFIEVDFSNQPIVPDFGPDLTQQLESCVTSQAALNKVVTKTKLLWDSIIKPLHQLCPEHAKFIQHYVQNVISDSDSLAQFEDKYTALLQVFGYPEFIKLDEVDITSLSENPDWLDLPNKEHTLNSLNELVELLKASNEDQFQTPPADLIEQNLKEPVVTPTGEASQPKEPVIPTGEQALPQTTLPAVKQALSSVEEGLQTGKEVALQTEEKALNAAVDLTEWDVFLQAGLEYFKDDRLVSAIKEHAEAVRSQILNDATLESAPALAKYEEQVTDLIAAFKRLDVAQVQKTSDFHVTYMESEPRLQHLSDYLFNEYVSANIPVGDVESIAEASQEINTSVDTYLAALNQSFTEFEASYFKGLNSEANTDLSEYINAITKNPLYFDGLFGAQFNILKAAVSGNETVSLKTAKDLTWYLGNLIDKSSIGLPQLALVTKAFNVLEPADQSSELNEMFRAAFNKSIQELSASDPQELLKLYQNISIYLPQNLQTPQYLEFQQIANYWSRYNTDTELAKPTKEAIEKLRDSASSPAVKNFYTSLVSEYDSTNSQQKSDTFLEKIKENSSIKSVSLKDDLSRLDIEFEGLVGKLTFLPLETESGTVFVQQAPLSLQEYIELSNLCDFDTEYYMTLQDSLWPRSFEVGMSAGFSAMGEWQFRNRDTFSSINAFSRKTLPAHLNEPLTVLRMAERLGLRLLQPRECATLVRLTSAAASSPLEFSAADKENLNNANTIQSSVYAQSISELMEQGEWSGGVDFERGIPVANKFFDVIGGSAELAYDGTNYYVLGGSWLYRPADLAKPVRIAEPKRMYLDLGVRFAVDAPTRSFAKMVQKVALQVLTGRR